MWVRRWISSCHWHCHYRGSHFSQSWAYSPVKPWIEKEVHWRLHISLFIRSKGQIVILKGQELSVSPALWICPPRHVRMTSLMETHGQVPPRDQGIYTLAAASKLSHQVANLNFSIRETHPWIGVDPDFSSVTPFWLCITSSWGEACSGRSRLYFIHGYLPHWLCLVDWKRDCTT